MFFTNADNSATVAVKTSSCSRTVVSLDAKR